MRITGFKNANIVFEKGVKNASLSVNDGKIAGFFASDGAIELPENLYVAPGFVDEHIHGAMGCDTMDASVESLEIIATSLLQEGVTSFLATTMTESGENIEKSMVCVRDYMKGTHPGAQIRGLHLEGPFISVKYKGSQDEQHIKRPDAALFHHYNELSGMNIKEVTFAYEEEGGDEFLQYCLSHGVTPSIGHSNASGDKAREGFGKGIYCVTHLYNAQTPLHHRNAGIVGEALITDGVHTEVICDLRHICADALKVVFRNKKKEDIVLISDSSPAKYLPEGQSSHLGKQPIWVKDGVAVLENGTIAASILHLDQALRNIRPIAEGYSYADLINLVTINPARNVHLDKEVGSIEEGKRADFVILDEDFHVAATIVGGEVVYRGENCPEILK